MKNKFNLGDNLFYFYFNASDSKRPNLFIHQVTIDAMKVRDGKTSSTSAGETTRLLSRYPLTGLLNI